MKNKNAKVSAQMTPGSKGVKSGVNPKATVTPKMKKGGMKKKAC